MFGDRLYVCVAAVLGAVALTLAACLVVAASLSDRHTAEAPEAFPAGAVPASATIGSD